MATSGISNDRDQISHDVSGDLERLYTSKWHSDITLVVDGTEFHSHKNILACRSEFFYTMFNSQMRESTQKIIPLKEKNAKIFERILRYIYTGQFKFVDLNIDDQLQTLDMANRYRLMALVESTVQYLTSKLTVDNVCIALAASHLFSLELLKQECLDFTDAQPTDVLNSAGLVHLPLEAMKELIGRDSLGAPEIDIFRSACRWMRENSGIDGSSIFEHIRPQLMTDQELVREFIPTLAELELQGIMKHEFFLKVLASMKIDHSKPKLVRASRKLGINVATSALGARVIEGFDPAYLLDGNTSGYSTYSYIGSPIGVELSDVYIIDTLGILLNGASKYSVQTKADQQCEWDMVIDKTDQFYESLQTLEFTPRPVKYIRITGTATLADSYFHIIHFECMAKKREQQLEKQTQEKHHMCCA